MLHHITRQIRRPDLEPCISFYEAIGFGRVEVPQGIQGRAVWLERSGTQIHLMPDEEAVPERGHLAVIVEDYERVVERLRGEGHDVEPRRRHWGSPRAYVRDPAGNLVELMAWAPGEAARRDGHR